MNRDLLKRLEDTLGVRFVRKTMNLPEGISADGLSGQTDGGTPGVAGGATHDARTDDDDEVNESDVVPFGGAVAGTNPIQTPTSEPLPFNRAKKIASKLKVRESQGWLSGFPTDRTSTGLISIKVLDDINISIHAPQRIIEQVEAYHLFEQFQILLPNTPMLSIRVMEQIASWWRNYSQRGDILEINCTTGQTLVKNDQSGTYYSLGSLGSMPDMYR